MGKLHDQMQEDLLLKAYSPHTQKAYLCCARHFANHYMRSPEEMGEQEIRGFLLHLVRDRKASPAMLGMYINALKFLYNVTLKRPEAVKGISHPKRPKTLPVILSPEEVLRVFEAIRSVKYKAIIAAAYAAGLRISEVCGLRIADIDSQRMRIYIRSGKCKKDRYAMLGESLLALLRQYYQTTRPPGEYLFPGQKPQRPISTRVMRLLVPSTQ
jgi:integrase/recombinase XerD